MKIFNQISEMKAFIREQQASGNAVGFIPTMGALHEGHLSMVKRAAKENNIVVVSIFVNPLQFGKPEEADRYPANMEKDLKSAESAGTHVIFHPDVMEMYPEGYKTYIEVKEISDVLCGVKRKGHFIGVATVVLKLLNIVHPDRAYFGQKDAQQAVIIKQMVRDLNMDPEIIVSPTIRENDGLAMSSRNILLSELQRSNAAVMYRSLKKAIELVNKGISDCCRIKSEMEQILTNQANAEVEYISIVEAESLKEVKKIQGKVLVAVAVLFDSIRLIDNVTIEV